MARCYDGSVSFPDDPMVSILLRAASSVIEPLDVDARGHLVRLGTPSDPRPTAVGLSLAMRGDEAGLAAIARAWEMGRPTDEPVAFTVTHGPERCGDCGANAYLTDGRRVWASEPCAHPDGLSVQARLEVPSGRLFVANDLRDAFPVAVDDFSVNEPSGIRDCVEAYAEEGGMLHFFVGNSCPGVHALSDERVVVGTAEYDDDAAITTDLGGTCVGSVCTDLWWVSIADAGEAARRGLHADGTSAFEVEVVPGTYVLDYYALLRGFERYPERGVTVFGQISRLGADTTPPGHWPGYARSG